MVARDFEASTNPTAVMREDGNLRWYWRVSGSMGMSLPLYLTQPVALHFIALPARPLHSRKYGSCAAQSAHLLSHWHLIVGLHAVETNS